MSGVERENRAGHDGGPLWRVELDDKDSQFSNRHNGRRLILEPRTCPHPDRGAELYVWIEDRKPRYHWISDEPQKRPRASEMPTVVIDTIEVPNSRRYEYSRHPLEYVIIQALAKNELVGESAVSAMHNLFWSHFVDDDDGLHYLNKFGAKGTGNWYAWQRLRSYIEIDERSRRNGHARYSIKDAMKDHDETLGERFCRRVAVDPNIRDAIEALRKTDEPQDVQLQNVRQLVLLNAPRIDHVIARIVDTCGEEHALLGLRACQRLERDAGFLAAVDAYVLAHPDGKGLPQFLKPHCPPPKPRKLTINDDGYYEEVDDVA